MEGKENKSDVHTHSMKQFFYIKQQQAADGGRLNKFNSNEVETAAVSMLKTLNQHGAAKHCSSQSVSFLKTQNETNNHAECSETQKQHEYFVQIRNLQIK